MFILVKTDDDEGSKWPRLTFDPDTTGKIMEESIVINSNKKPEK